MLADKGFSFVPLRSRSQLLSRFFSLTPSIFPTSKHIPRVVLGIKYRILSLYLSRSLSLNVPCFWVSRIPIWFNYLILAIRCCCCSSIWLWWGHTFHSSQGHFTVHTQALFICESINPPPSDRYSEELLMLTYHTFLYINNCLTFPAKEIVRLCPKLHSIPQWAPAKK